MANPTWPAGLEDCPLAGWSERAMPNIITFDAEVGAQKRRRRSTNSGYEYSAQYKMRHADVQTFWNWYENDLLDGVLRFDLVHPRTGTVVTMQMESPPEVRQEAPQLYIVSLAMRAFV